LEREHFPAPHLDRNTCPVGQVLAHFTGNLLLLLLLLLLVVVVSFL
jgi:hypothetical protein